MKLFAILMLAACAAFGQLSTTNPRYDFNYAAKVENLITLNRSSSYEVTNIFISTNYTGTIQIGTNTLMVKDLLWRIEDGDLLRFAWERHTNEWVQQPYGASTLINWNGVKAPTFGEDTSDVRGGRGAVYTHVIKESIDFGDTEETDFFVIRLKDKFAGVALRAYAMAAEAYDPEYANEIHALADQADAMEKRMPD